MKPLVSVLLCADPVVPDWVERAGRVAATEVRDLLLVLQGIPESAKEPL